MTKKIILPEGTEERTIRATETIIKGKIADIVLIGNDDEIKSKAKSLGVNIDGSIIVDPIKSEKYEEYVNLFLS